MAISSDVLVVGGGLAGATAALSAAREGATVRLVSYKKSTLRFASGLIDLLGYVPAGDDGSAGDGPTAASRTTGVSRATAAGRGPIADPFVALGDLPDAHPYGVVGEEAIREGFALFDDVAGDLYRGGHTDRNALVVTHGGTVKPTARYPASVAAGLASDDREALLVGFESLTDFDAPLAADHLRAAGVPFEVRGITASFGESFRADAKVTRFARALDRDEPVEGTPIRRAVADAIEPHLGSAERVGFPALLGDDRPGEVRAELGDRLGADVFEVPTGPPSLPGLRLEDRLFEALDAAGIRIETGNPVVGYEAGSGRGATGGGGSGGGGRVEAVRVDRKGRETPYYADQFVLATGGLVGKGVDSSRAGVEEPIFGCRVPHPEDRYEWSDADAFGDHAFARFGVVPDSSLRPTGASGAPEFENLRAAGAVLGGADAAGEKSAGGVSLATGVAAGRNAAAALRGDL
jgi:glycerol-3-phosphate dehydrogenase subunit B